jgi:uncharacterized membrane protein YphA (DoxX/SURF4 family)
VVTLAAGGLLVRVYCGYQWIEAGWAKLQNPAWFGSGAGGALRGFVDSALQNSTGDHPDVTGWYAGFVQAFVLPNATLFANLGELLVGVGPIVETLAARWWHGPGVVRSTVVASLVCRTAPVVGKRKLGQAGRRRTNNDTAE